MAPSLPRSFAGRHKETVITIMFIPEETVVREKMLRWCQLVPLLVELDMRRVIPPQAFCYPRFPEAVAISIANMTTISGNLLLVVLRQCFLICFRKE